jgi:hypothetical protein
MVCCTQGQAAAMLLNVFVCESNGHTSAREKEYAFSQCTERFAAGITHVHCCTDGSDCNAIYEQ